VPCLYSHPRSSLKSTVHRPSLTTQPPAPSNLTPIQSPYNLLATIVIRRWDRSRPICPGMIRIYPGSPVISSSESSFLEGQTPERRPSCSGCVTPQRVQRSTGVINRDIARRCVPVPSRTARLISLSIQVQLDPTIEVGQPYSYW
jgi:hypothetical protein